MVSLVTFSSLSISRIFLICLLQISVMSFRADEVDDGEAGDDTV
jgi:hypothetical protein